MSLLHILVISGFNDFGPSSYDPTILTPGYDMVYHFALELSSYVDRYLWSTFEARASHDAVNELQCTLRGSYKFSKFHRLILLRWFPDDGHRIPWLSNGR